MPRAPIRTGENSGKPGGGQPGEQDGLEFGEGAEGELDVQAERVAAAAATAEGALVSRMREVIEEADTLAQAREALLVEFGEMDEAALAAVMQRALVASEFAGRYEVREEVV